MRQSRTGKTICVLTALAGSEDSNPAAERLEKVPMFGQILGLEKGR